MRYMKNLKESFLKMCESAENRRDERKLLSSLGLCVRAGAVIVGAPMICDGMRGAKKPLIVLEASDTSENTHKRLTDKCKYYCVKHIRLECDGITLAAALGKSSSLAAVAVTDENMKKMVEKHI